MKILHVIPGLSPVLGGPPQVALNLVRALCDLGVEAEIVTTDYDGSDRLDVPLNQKVDYPFGQNLTAPVWFLPHNPPALKEFIFSSALTRWLWQHIPQYDVLDHHYLFSYAPTCAATIAHLRQIPYTVRTMGQLTPWALAQSRFKKQLYTTLLERRNLKQAALIHCTSPAEAEDVRNFGIHTPTATVPLGVIAAPDQPDAKRRLHQQYQIPDPVPIVLYLSRLHYKKRPELLLQSLSLLQQQTSFHLIMAGAGEAEYLEQLQHLTHTLGLSDSVSFPGLVLGAEKDLLLQGSDLFVLPSFSENFGIAVAEALVAGLPVVITPGVQIATEIAAANAGLIVAGNVESLSAAITQLLNSAALRQQLSRNGQQFARERYAWSAIAQQTLQLYESIATRNPRPKAFEAECQ